MQRKPLIAGNWKMYLSVEEASALAADVADSVKGISDRDVMIAPSYTSLATVARVLEDSTVYVAGQNVCWDEQGAYTGEISGNMLRDAGASMVIVGHSERRHIFKENDSIVNSRLLGALESELLPILCVGETLEQRDSGKTFDVISEQVSLGLKGVDVALAEKIVVAYEPVWAIGTGKTATKEMAQDVHAFIRSILVKMFNKNIANNIRILYGGSVKPENIDSLMAEPDIDGALVGGASLKSQSFDRIIKFKL